MSQPEQQTDETEEQKFQRVEEAAMHRILEQSSRLEEGIEGSVKMAESRAASFMGNYLRNFSELVKSQHRELSIFRRLETHMRNNTTTNEVVVDTMNALLEHRESVQKATSAAIEEANKKALANAQQN